MASSNEPLTPPGRVMPDGLQCVACLTDLPTMDGPYAITVIKGYASCKGHLPVFMQNTEFREFMTEVRYQRGLNHDTSRQ